MRVLDVDLDFFLQERPCRKHRDGRLPNGEYHPWAASRVEQYLIANCGLTKNEPIPGKFVTYHHEVFEFCKTLILSGDLRTPFHLTHLDSHADMGMSKVGQDNSAGYIMGELLHQCIDKRREPIRDGYEGLLESNWISFVLACRWLSGLTYVHHPALLRQNSDLHDVPDCLFKDYDPRCGIIQLKKLPRNCRMSGKRLSEFIPLALEPEVPIEFIDCHSFQEKEPYSFVFVAQSPNYTPASADHLLEVIGQFIGDEV